MNNDYTHPSFKKLLQKLQEESWQLELIISGFAIFGLFTAYGPIGVQAKLAQVSGSMYTSVVMVIVQIACAILIFNLLLHVILRGLWIGTLGLRYVSGDIDYDTLNYSEKFTRFLKKRVGSFDKYIATLENYCSIIFAISFLLIFYVLAITFTIISIAFVANGIIQNDSFPKSAREIAGGIIILLLVIGMIFTFIDFATQGWLKKKKWISKIYFPIYLVFSIITLSFLYRPIVYNFLDNKFGKRLSFVLLPIYFTILYVTTLNYQNSNYYISIGSSNASTANIRNYDEFFDGENVFIDKVSIPSKVISTPYLNIFMALNENIENYVFNFNESLKPKHDNRGLNSNMIKFSSSDIKNLDSIKTVYLKTLNKVFQIKIDSVVVEYDFVITKDRFDILGFETFIETGAMAQGKHVLSINRKFINKSKDTLLTNYSKIPYWYFKN